MRRDYFTLQVRDVDWIEQPDEPPACPTLEVGYEGPTEAFLTRFERDGAHIPATELDVAYRLQGPFEDPSATGVLSLTDRLTGEFILEVNAPAEVMVSFLRAARRYGETIADDSARFVLAVDAGGDQFVFEKRALLVYNADGTLLRRHSLIPSGVEL